ncbi:MAG: MlaD family protein [Kiloniellales bacterium]
METRANYLMVGGFVLLLAIGLVIFVIWLAKFQFDTQYTRYDIFFTGSVTGLHEGSAVRYSGVKVGEVVFIGLDRDNPSQVRALIEVTEDTPVRVDTVASLALEGLTGGRYILLSGGSLDSAPLTTPEGAKRPIIPSKRSAFDEVIEGAPEVMASANVLLMQANELLGAENRNRIAFILDNVAVASQVLAERSSDLDHTIRDTATTMANLRNATTALEEMAQGLRADSARLAERADAALTSIETMAGSIDSSVSEVKIEARQLVADLSGTAAAFTAMAGEFQALAKENREPLLDFSQSGLYELNNLLVEARELLIGLNRVTTEVQRDPARFLFGNQQQGYEAPR